MILGLDFHNVITQFPDEMSAMADAVTKDGGKVFIVSAITEKGLDEHGGEEAYKAEIAKFGVMNDGIVVVIGPNEMFPRLKYVAIRDKKIDVFIDDRPDIIKFLHEKGECAIQMPKPLYVPKKKSHEIP